MSKILKNQMIFLISIIVAISIIIYGYFFPQKIGELSTIIMTWVSEKFGWLYVLFVSFLCVFLAWLAFGKYGNLKLGRDSDVPEYSNFNWYAMLFCGGTGIGLVFWSLAEPLSHYVNPPEGIEAGTIEAMNFSIRTCFLHWGITQWVCFALVGLGIAFFQFRKGESAQISNLISPIVGKDITNRLPGKMIDIFSVIVSFAGVATSLGLGVSQICGGLSYLTNIPNNKSAWFAIIVFITCIFIISAISGVNKGIKYLSKINIFVAFILLIIAFAVGPHVSIFNTMINGIGQHIQNFFGDVLMINSFSDNTWIMNWRIFYYAWFIAWTPFVGMFIARISKGRTVREFLIGVIVIPTVFTIIWLSVFGTIALSTTIGWSLESIRRLVSAPETAVFIVFSEYPFSKVISALIIVLLAIFFITSADSATYSLSIMTSEGNMNAPTYKKIIWGIIEAAIAYTLLSVGSLKPLQTLSIAASLPFLFIMILMCPALVKELEKEIKETAHEKSA